MTWTGHPRNPRLFSSSAKSVPGRRSCFVPESVPATHVSSTAWWIVFRIQISVRPVAPPWWTDCGGGRPTGDWIQCSLPPAGMMWIAWRVKGEGGPRMALRVMIMIMIMIMVVIVVLLRRTVVMLVTRFVSRSQYRRHRMDCHFTPSPPPLPPPSPPSPPPTPPTLHRLQRKTLRHLSIQIPVPVWNRSGNRWWWRLTWQRTSGDGGRAATAARCWCAGPFRTCPFTIPTRRVRRRQVGLRGRR
mmetsp:Transcript_26880/g.49434  ORF Transcript_26880/g.49434 Transcript_26880/m.49434 type:complete len:244 (+) Transcript_26880:686-1417(+)